MAIKRALGFSGLVVCLVFVFYASVDPTWVIGQSSCCALPLGEQPTAAGPAPTDATITDFDMLVWDPAGDNFDGSWTGEYTPNPSPDDDSCYERDQSTGVYFDQVSSPWTAGYYWVMGYIGYRSTPSDHDLNDYQAHSANNSWGYDGVGYGTVLVSDYRRDLGAQLPCGTQITQDIYLRCPNHTWYYSIDNTLTATINLSSVTNCHEDTYGDYSACETEQH